MAKATAGGNVLELGDREASILLKVLRNVGGDPAGPRGVMDRIEEALTKAGVQAADLLIDRGMYIEDVSAEGASL